MVENEDTIKNNVVAQIVKYQQLIKNKNAELDKVTKDLNDEGLNDTKYNKLVESLTKITGDLSHLNKTCEYLVDIFTAQTGKEELEKSKHEYETKRNQNNKNIAYMTSANKTMEEQKDIKANLTEMKQFMQINKEQIEAQTQQNAEYNAMIDSINMELKKLNIQPSNTQPDSYKKKYLKYKQKYLLLKKK